MIAIRVVSESSVDWRKRRDSSRTASARRRAALSRLMRTATSTKTPSRSTSSRWLNEKSERTGSKKK